jgi:hypothetical protein
MIKYKYKQDKNWKALQKISHNGVKFKIKDNFKDKIKIHLGELTLKWDKSF